MSSSVSRITIKDFFRNPEKVAFTISPDGENVAFLAPYESRLNVHIQNIETGNIRRITSETSRNISGLHWANDTCVVFLRDVDGDENWQVFAANIDDSGTRALTPFSGVQSSIQDLLKDSPDEIMISCNKRNSSCFDVYRLNINSGEMTMVAENPGNIVGWMLDHNAKVRVAITSDGVNHGILYRETEADSFRELLKTDFRVSVSPLMFDFNNEKFYVSSNRNRNTSGIYLFNPQTSTEEELLFGNDEYDASSILSSDARKCITGYSYYSSKQEIVLVDEHMKQVYEHLAQSIPGKQVVVVDHSRDENRLIVASYSDRSPTVYYLYDVTTSTLALLAESKPWLHERDLASIKPVRYTTRDGLTVHGYLTLPAGVEPKNLPVIMYPHGGPWVRDKWGFDPNIQFFANRGYAVMQMNYRGSTGYGRTFWEASFKQWGRAMQDDISDAVAWLIKEGIADASKVAIVGGSYGGYAVLAGLAFTPLLYCCGVDIVGVSNLFTFRETVPDYWKPMAEMMNEMVGDPVADEELMRSVSPYFHADKIVAPLLVFQGAQDPRVNIAESEQIVEALRSRGVEVEYVVKHDEGHGFHNEENKLEMFETMERFLEEHLRSI